MFVTAEITGSKAQQTNIITLANALAITDITQRLYNGGTSWSTAGSVTAIPDWNKYNRHALFVLNSHDQDITLRILSKLRGNVDILQYGVPVAAQNAVIPKTGGFAPIMLTSDTLKALNGIQPDDISIALVSATAAPTTGSITIKLVQWAE